MVRRAVLLCFVCLLGFSRADFTSACGLKVILYQPENGSVNPEEADVPRGSSLIGDGDARQDQQASSNQRQGKRLVQDNATAEDAKHGHEIDKNDQL